MIRFWILILKGGHHRKVGHPDGISCCEMRPETMNFVEPTGRTDINIDVPIVVSSEPPVPIMQSSFPCS